MKIGVGILNRFARKWTVVTAGLIALLIFSGCGGTQKGGSMLDSFFSSIGIPIDSGGKVPGSSNQVTYTETDTPVQLPVDFGTAGPQAILNLANLAQVDRYKSLEIVFSEPMVTSTVQTDFVLTENSGTALPGPSGNKGGVFYWKSGGRLIFDPYRELKPNTTYKLTLTSASKGLEGGNLQPYTITFTTEPDYLISMTLNGTAVGPGNSVKDLTFADATPGTIVLNLNASFSNPVNPNQIQSVKLQHLNSSTVYTICSAPCDMTAPLAASMNLNAFSGANAGLKPYQGGNAYEFLISTADGKTFRRSFGFNYGKINSTPYALIPKGAATVFDEAQTLKLFSGLLERLAHNDFKIGGKTLFDYSNSPTLGTKRSSYCINYSDANITYIRSYGDATDFDSSATYGDGYCGASGANPGAFVQNGCFTFIFSFCSDFDIDVYITSVNMPATSGSSNNLNGGLKATANNELTAQLNGKTAIINLAMVARNRSSLATVSAGNYFYFTATAELNYNLSTKPSRLTQAKTNSSVDSTGSFVIQIKTPFTPTDPITGNFYTSEWSGNLTVYNMNQVSSTDWLADLISSIGTGIANQMTASLTPKITQVMLRDVFQNILPSTLNAVVLSLNNPGLDVVLPNYLPAPLSNFPLSLKLKAQTDAAVKVSGSNKGVVSSADVGLVAKSPLASSDPNYHGHLLSTGFVSTRPIPSTDPLTSSFAFSKSAANPGLLLTLTADTVTQAAYSLWQNGALNLRINKTFIDTIVAYAGTDPLFQLTQQLVKVGTLLNILAPGRSTLVGLNPSNQSLLVQNVSATDDVDIDVYAIHAPNGEFKFAGTNAIPTLVVNFTDLELRIYGRRPNGTNNGVATCSSAAADSASNSCRYLLNTVRVSIKGNGNFNFVSFVNPDPTNLPQYNNLNAMSLVINKDEASMSYFLDIMEGLQYNPFGLDPKGIFQVVDPLIRSLIIPLVNNVLRQVPLPQSLNLAALTHPTKGTVCNLPSTTDKLKLITVPIPNTEPYPYLFGGLQFQGTWAADPVTTIVCP
ncbi:Ig-like protein [Leptospira langatensis]|uniref:Ig-like protein n=1 Tax=Leptospira langatensis TaxID=2484983 RepID=A0A5F1ZVW4_9LEPT|nr:Ig-like domain-containing protein [Leptospira langatensis]TGK00111.1 Ig-like protein [Leptospira langatensis]TGL42745.1 Ig-like protein [Leptospira langatensis]